MDGQANTVNGGDDESTATSRDDHRAHAMTRKSRRRHAMARLLATGIGLGALARFGTQTAQAANGDPVLAGQTVDATAPTRVRNNVSTTPDSTADGVQGYATGANNAGLFGRNNVTDGIGVAGAAPSGTGVFGESINGFGVGGRSTSGVGVRGESTSGVGAAFSGGLAVIRLIPAATGTGAPTTGAHQVGELYADSTGVLYYCTVAGTPGTWLPVVLGSGGSSMTNPMTAQDDLIVGGTSGAPTRLAKGSNGQVLTLSGSGHVAWETPSGGGGGSGNGFMAAITAPPSSGWSWLNQGSATVSRINDAEVLDTPAATGNQIRGRYRSLPSGNYALTALVAPNVIYKNFLMAGLFLRESSSGKLMTFGPGFANGGNVATIKYNSETSHNANYLAFPADVTAWWLRIQDDGTNRICFVSVDGRAFVEIHRVGRTDFITPDQVGFFTNAINQTTPNLTVSISLVSWNGVS